jgi:tight adherence protein C
MTVAGATLLCVTLGLIGAVYPDIWLRETTQKRERQIFKSLPFFLDVITLSVEAGTNITGAFTQAVQRAPDGPLKSEFGRFLRDVRAGKSRAEALRALADRMQLESINSFVGSVIQAERMGGSLGQVLRAQADQRRSERFLRAEKQAMEAPVKLLGPLVAFIFPTTFMVLIFVLLYKAAEGGVVTSPTLLWALTWPAQR